VRLRRARLPELHRPAAARLPGRQAGHERVWMLLLLLLMVVHLRDCMRLRGHAPTGPTVWVCMLHVRRLLQGMRPGRARAGHLGGVWARHGLHAMRQRLLLMRLRAGSPRARSGAAAALVLRGLWLLPVLLQARHAVAVARLGMRMRMLRVPLHL
jgi:hypothetical protein